jgi:hypothetical protein
MWLTSTAETGVPSGSELILVFLDDLLDLTQLYPREPCDEGVWFEASTSSGEARTT